MRHFLTYAAVGSIVCITVGVFLQWGLAVALIVTGVLFLCLSVYSAERIANVPDQTTD